MGEDKRRGTVQGGRDVGISLITISIRGWAQSTGLGCPCTEGQKPQEEDNGKEERSGKKTRQGEKRSENKMRRRKIIKEMTEVRWGEIG